MLDVENKLSRVVYEDHEHNKQYAASAFYQKNWQNGSRTKMSGAYSTLDKEINSVRQFGRRQAGQGNGGQGGFNNQVSQDQLIFNMVSEANISLEHHIPLSENQQFEFGAAMAINEVSFREDSFEVNLTAQKFEGSRLNIYVQDAISLAPGIEFKLGIRSN
jgi:outer membrane receptor for ferrienterochelin and colicin